MTSSSIPETASVPALRATEGSATATNVGLVAILLIFDSLHFVFARLLLPLVSPTISATLVLAVGTVEVGIFGIATRRIHWKVARDHLWLFGTIGLLIAVSTAIQYEAVAFIDAGTASLLSQTTALFSLGFGLFWLHDRLTPLQIAGAGLALVGLFMTAFQPGDYLRLGALLVVSSSFMYALHAALSKRYAGAIGLTDFFFFRLFFTTGVLIPIAASRGILAWPTPKAWGLLLLVGTVDVALSRTLYYLALRRLTMSMHTIALTLSPIAAILWALLIFSTLPTVRQLLGGAAILAGVLIVTIGRSKTTGVSEL